MTRVRPGALCGRLRCDHGAGMRRALAAEPLAPRPAARCFTSDSIRCSALSDRNFQMTVPYRSHRRNSCALTLHSMRARQCLSRPRRRWAEQERAVWQQGWRSHWTADASSRTIRWVSHCIGARKTRVASSVNDNAVLRAVLVRGAGSFIWCRGSALGACWGRGGRRSAPSCPARIRDGCVWRRALHVQQSAAVHHASAMTSLCCSSSEQCQMGAVERSTLAMLSTVWARTHSESYFMQLRGPAAFEDICKAAGGHGDASPIPPPSARSHARDGVVQTKSAGLLNVICGPGGSA